MFIHKHESSLYSRLLDPSNYEKYVYLIVLLPSFDIILSIIMKSILLEALFINFPL